jgi:hypothetical protein
VNNLKNNKRMDTYEEEIQRQATRHKDSLQFAKENWDHPQLQATVKAVVRTLHDLAAAEAAKGLHIRSRENYVPGHY